MGRSVTCVLRQVTLWHPEDLLKCTVAELKSRPHLVRLRERSDQRRLEQHERDGFELKTQVFDDGIVRRGHGNQIKRYRDTSAKGALLRPFIEPPVGAKPVLIYVPDEIKGKAKWKCELRTIDDWRIQLRDDYPHGFESLPARVGLYDQQFYERVLNSTFRVCGFWENPSHSLSLPDNMAINLALGPITGRDLPPAGVWISQRRGRCWIDYTVD